MGVKSFKMRRKKSMFSALITPMLWTDLSTTCFGYKIANAAGRRTFVNIQCINNIRWLKPQSSTFISYLENVTCRSSHLFWSLERSGPRWSSITRRVFRPHRAFRAWERSPGTSITASSTLRLSGPGISTGRAIPHPTGQHLPISGQERWLQSLQFPPVAGENVAVLTKYWLIISIIFLTQTMATTQAYDLCIFL